MSRNSVSQHRLYRKLARQKYSYVFFTSIAPLLLAVSGLCNAIGNSGGVAAFFSKHWIIGPIGILVILGLLMFSILEMCEARSYARKADEFLR